MGKENENDHLYGLPVQKNDDWRITDSWDDHSATLQSQPLYTPAPAAPYKADAAAWQNIHQQQRDSEKQARQNQNAFFGVPRPHETEAAAAPYKAPPDSDKLTWGWSGRQMQKIASGQDSTGFNAALAGMQQLEADNRRLSNTHQPKDITSFRAIPQTKIETYLAGTNEEARSSLPRMADLIPETYDSEALRYSAFSAPDQTPYRAMGQLMQPASDKFRTDVVEPIGRQIVSAIRNKQPVNPAEQDLVNIAGKFTESAKNTYTRENLINAADAIHQGETRHNEAAYRHPPRSDDVLTSLHAADTWSVEETMANPDSNTTKGFENSLRDINLSEVAPENWTVA